MDNFKHCNLCSTSKPHSDFHKDGKGRFGLSAYCKECNKARSKARRIGDERAVKGSRLKHMFNVTVDQYEQMMLNQGGVCAICGGVNANGRALSVDHDHACCSGKKSCGKCVRALLCGDCNMGLGKFRDNPELLQAAIDYVRMKRP